jgi:hypothetical protein
MKTQGSSFSFQTVDKSDKIGFATVFLYNERIGCAFFGFISKKQYYYGLKKRCLFKCKV